MGFLHSFSFFFSLFCSSGLIHCSYLQLNYAVFIVSNLLQIISIAFFISFIEIFSSRISVWFFFYDFYHSAKLLILFRYYFLISLNCLSVSSTSPYFLKRAILNSLSGINHNSAYLGSITRDLQVVSCFLDFPRSLKCCMAVFSAEVTVTSSVLLTTFRREIPPISPARDSEAFSDLLWI